MSELDTQITDTLVTAIIQEWERNELHKAANKCDDSDDADDKAYAEMKRIRKSKAKLTMVPFEINEDNKILLLRTYNIYPNNISKKRRKNIKRVINEAITKFATAFT